MANCEKCENRIGCENYEPKSTTACEHYAEDTQQLKPCPFCGGKAEVFEEKGGEVVSIACSECGCGTAYMSGASSAEKKIEIATQDWNRRAENERKTD